MRKMHASLALLLTALAGAAQGADTKRMIVAYKPGAAPGIRAMLMTANGAVRHDIYGMNAVAADLPAAAVRQLRSDPGIDYVEEDVIRHLFALSTPSTGAPYALGQQVPYGVQLVQADQLADANPGNRKLCIIDSGVERAHEDLVGNSANMSGDDDPGTGNWYTDESQHGTHVAGTIAALNNSAVGVVGVNPNGQLKLHFIKVFGADGWAYSSTLISAANKCAAAGANVISMSLGGPLPSKTELRAFDALAKGGVLSVAAAGNGGNTSISFPAGYPSVMMVGALDQNKAWASFSQYNRLVAIAAPGVAVLSSVPTNTGSQSALKVGTVNYAPGAMQGAPLASVSAPLADFGLGDKTDSGLKGKVCLIARGSIDFATKVGNCEASGGLGAIIYNNTAGGFNGTLGTTATHIPSVSASDSEGAAMLGQLDLAATLAVTPASYAYFDGTSMATPHVSAVAALVWSYFPDCSGAQIRASLTKSALDLGPAGRDNKYGYGLVQAKAAKDRIDARGCGK
ncbi:MAG: S8 family serine peptidase [Pseudomonadota bacterium]